MCQLQLRLRQICRFLLLSTTLSNTFVYKQARKEGTGGPGKATAVNRTSVPITQAQTQQPGLGGVAKGMGQMNQGSMMPSKPITTQLPGSTPTILPGTNQAVAPTSLPPQLPK